MALKVHFLYILLVTIETIIAVGFDFQIETIFNEEDLEFAKKCPQWKYVKDRNAKDMETGEDKTIESMFSEALESTSESELTKLKIGYAYFFGFQYAVMKRTYTYAFLLTSYSYGVLNCGGVPEKVLDILIIGFTIMSDSLEKANIFEYIELYEYINAFKECENTQQTLNRLDKMCEDFVQYLDFSVIPKKNLSLNNIYVHLEMSKTSDETNRVLTYLDGFMGPEHKDSIDVSRLFIYNTYGFNNKNEFEEILQKLNSFIEIEYKWESSAQS